MAIKEILKAKVLMKYRSTQKHKLDMKRRFSIIIFKSICLIPLKVDFSSNFFISNLFLKSKWHMYIKIKVK